MSDDAVVTPIERRMFVCENGHKWKEAVPGQGIGDSCQDESCGAPVQEWVPDWLDLPKELVELLGEALAEEITFFNASPESWQKVIKGMLTKAIRKVTTDPYTPSEVVEQEIQVMDLVLLIHGIPPGALSRVEAVNLILDQVALWKEISKTLGTALEIIQQQSDPTHMRDIASAALSTAAAEIGG